MDAVDSNTVLQGKTTESAWSPLGVAAFRQAWLLSLLSFASVMMSDLAAVWWISSLTARSDIIALAQSSAYLTLILLAIPSGVITELFDRRLLIVAVHLALGAVLAGFLIGTAAPGMSIWLLLVLILCQGACASIIATTWQVATPELVPRVLLGSAVTLVLTGYNISRLTAPALGSAIILLVGPFAVFWIGAAISLSVVMALLFSRWPRAVKQPGGIREGFVRAFRMIAASVQVRRVCARGFAFAFCANAVWALLPVIARARFGEQATGFGLLTSSLGLGAIVATGAIPQLRTRLGLNALLYASSCGLAVGAFLLAYADTVWLACLFGLVIGCCWLGGTTAMSIAVREAAPRAQQGPAYAMYLLLFSLGMILGGAVWGSLTLNLGFAGAVKIAAAVFLLGTPILSLWLPVSGKADAL